MTVNPYALGVGHLGLGGLGLRPPALNLGLSTLLPP